MKAGLKREITYLPTVNTFCIAFTSMYMIR